MNNYVEILFTDLQPEQQDMLIAHLAEAGFEGFEEGEHALKAFIPENNYDKRLLQEIVYKYQLQFAEKTIPEQNWNHLWESNFQPVVIGDFAAVRAEFHEPVPGVKHEIIITPKMSFGTGHHATTHMMMQQMREIDFTGKKVLDFGTGTGILAILAEQRGAAEVVAIDHDDWSIANAAENIERNHCCRVRLEKAHLLTGKEQYDIILANINKNLILDNFMAFELHLKWHGVLLLSGLLDRDEEEILQQADQYNFTVAGRCEQDKWICLRFNS